MAVLICAVVGLVLGGSAFGGFGAAGGALLGVVIGAVITGMRQPAAPARTAQNTNTMASRVSALELRVAELERELRAVRGTAPAQSGPKPFQAPEWQEPRLRRAAVATRPRQPVAPSSRRRREARCLPRCRVQRPSSASPHRQPRSLVTPAARHRPPANPIWAWIVGGNTMARVGVVLLFIGVGFLIKYAVEHVYVPISVRSPGRARRRRAARGRLAASPQPLRVRHDPAGRRRRHPVPHGVRRVAAVRADSAARRVRSPGMGVRNIVLARHSPGRGLAGGAVRSPGGFLAPILTSTQSGNHVLLFSYYALLNAGILGIAWFKAWRVLNLLGFAFTFVIGVAWGVTRYRPELLWTTEPFLILFFLFYVAIAVLYALRRQLEASPLRRRRHRVRHAARRGRTAKRPRSRHRVRDVGQRACDVGAVSRACAHPVRAPARGPPPVGRELPRARRAVRHARDPAWVDARWTSAAWAAEGAAIAWAASAERVRAFAHSVTRCNSPPALRS
jgi:uncharacterized membrane protein